MVDKISNLSLQNRIDESIKGGMLEACARHSDMFLKPRSHMTPSVLLWTVSPPPVHTQPDLHETLKACLPVRDQH